MNASIYSVLSGFQFYAGKYLSSFSSSLTSFSSGDGCVAVPSICRGTHIMAIDGLQAAMPYTIKWKKIW